MLDKRFLSAVLAVAAITASCTKELSEPAVLPINSAKVVNTRGAEFSNEILVKFNAVPDEAMIQQLKGQGVLSIERTLPSTKGKEELEARFGLDRWYSVILDDSSNADEIVYRLSAAGSVNAVQYGMKYQKASDCISYPAYPVVATKAVSEGFNDPMLVDQWHYRNAGNVSVATSVYKGADINVSRVWSDITCGDPGIVVAVVDEGVKHSHPDLKANMWVNVNEKEDGKDNDDNTYADDVYGWNFVSNGPITWDKPGDSGHGTHCAGTIAAVNNNGTGVCGVAGGSGKGDGVRIMSCQIFDDNYGGTTAVVAKAIKYAADMGASIISCSFGVKGGTFISDGAFKANKTLEYDAIKYFEASKNNDIIDGGLVIFASGNDGDPYATYPGALNDVISVSAFAPDFLPTYYTNYGPGCNIVAPGGEAGLKPYTSSKALVLSTLPSELMKDKSHYGYMQGTSMACPHVSGIAALGLSYAKQLGKKFTLREFKEMILASANDFETKLASGKKDYVSGANFTTNLPNYRKQMGTGSIDTWRLMMKIEGTPCLTAAVGRNQWMDLSDAFGTASVNLTYLDVKYDAADAEEIGLAEEPYIKYGRLYINPTKIGSAKFTITAVGGGTAVGGEDAIGGMEISQEVSVVVRPHKSDNGGWL